MDKHHQQSSAPTAAIVIVVVLLGVVVLLAGCVLVGVMFYRNTTHKTMVAREHALRAEAQARKAAEMERERAEELARAAKLVTENETDAATDTAEAKLDVTEFHIAINAEGQMSVDGEVMDLDQVKARLRQLRSHPPSHIVIQADEQCRMESVLRLLQVAEECKVDATIGTSHLEAEEAE